jgi:uncharacterized protein
MTDTIIISERERDILRNIFRPYADSIDTVGVFGSRAIGNARPASDIDLVLYGQLSDQQVQRLWSLFDESYLAVTVDLADYAKIRHAPLKRHIDASMKPLFNKADLVAA